MAILALSACAEHNAVPDGSTQVEDSGDASASGKDGGADASKGEGDAGDGGTDASCPVEATPMWEHDPGMPYDAVRVRLDELCGRYCREQAATLLAQPCEAADRDDAGVDDEDAGSESPWFGSWTRTEGCGRIIVEKTFAGGGWPRYYTFDSETDELIGYAQLDDVGPMVAGCNHYAYVAGELGLDCDDAVTITCE